jgi:hypothetical protein
MPQIIFRSFFTLHPHLQQFIVKKNRPLLFSFRIIFRANPAPDPSRYMIQHYENCHAEEKKDYFEFIICLQPRWFGQTVLVAEGPIDESVRVFVETFGERPNHFRHETSSFYFDVHSVVPGDCHVESSMFRHNRQGLEVKVVGGKSEEHHQHEQNYAETRSKVAGSLWSVWKFIGEDDQIFPLHSSQRQQHWFLPQLFSFGIQINEFVGDEIIVKSGSSQVVVDIFDRLENRRQEQKGDHFRNEFQ